MKKIIIYIFFIIHSAHLIRAQSTDTIPSTNDWAFNSDMSFYLIPDNFFILPVIRADKNHLHLEARYNYEDLNTFSAWAGYNFFGGKKLEYQFTPIFGGIIGNSNGFAPGFELDLTYKKFNWYYETEYFVDINEKENNFIYAWSDVTFSPKEWLSFGISAQRTRLYQTGHDIQRGLLIGAGFRNFEVKGYLYNLYFDEPFVIITLGYTF